MGSVRRADVAAACAAERAGARAARSARAAVGRVTRKIDARRVAECLTRGAGHRAHPADARRAARARDVARAAVRRICDQVDACGAAPDEHGRAPAGIVGNDHVRRAVEHRGVDTDRVRADVSGHAVDRNVRPRHIGLRGVDGRRVDVAVAEDRIGCAASIEQTRELRSIVRRTRAQRGDKDTCDGTMQRSHDSTLSAWCGAVNAGVATRSSYRDPSARRSRSRRERRRANP